AGQDADAALAHFRVELLHALELRGRAHVLFRAGLDAPLPGFVDARVDEADRRRDEDLVLLRLQEIERLVVGVAAVIDDAEAVLGRTLHRLGGLCMAGEVDAALASLVADRRDFFVGVGELLRAARRKRIVARQQELDRVDAGFRHLAHVGAQRLGRARVTLVCLQAERAIGQPLERRGAQPRPRYPAAVDLFAQRELEARTERPGGI